MSMKVTEGFIRRIDGFSNFTITILTNVIHASLNSVDIASIPTIYPELAQITEKKFFKNALNVENRVDTCLVALSGLSYEYAQSTERL